MAKNLQEKIKEKSKELTMLQMELDIITAQERADVEIANLEAKLKEMKK